MLLLKSLPLVVVVAATAGLAAGAESDGVSSLSSLNGTAAVNNGTLGRAGAS